MVAEVVSAVRNGGGTAIEGWKPRGLDIAKREFEARTLTGVFFHKYDGILIILGYFERCSLVWASNLIANISNIGGKFEFTSPDLKQYFSCNGYALAIESSYLPIVP